MAALCGSRWDRPLGPKSGLALAHRSEWVWVGLSGLVWAKRSRHLRWAARSGSASAASALSWVTLLEFELALSWVTWLELELATLSGIWWSEPESEPESALDEPGKEIDAAQ